MKDIITQVDDESFEPLDTIIELAEDYSMEAMLYAIQYICDLASKQDGYCEACKAEHSWLVLEIKQLLSRYETRFPVGNQYHINSRPVEV
jgi:hypothetical protein